MSEIKDEVKGLLKELAEDAVKTQTSEMKEELAAQKEANEKLVKDNKEFKEKMDSLQGKQITLEQNSGTNIYTFKGYNPDMVSNFRTTVSKELQNEVATAMVKALTEANTGAYAVPVEYSSALLGLAELKSVALAKARIMNVSSNAFKIPAKGTRATVDAQAFGTANASAATTLAQLAFTIDKRVGSYEVVNNDLLADEMFDVVGDWVEPAIAESIGQNLDDEMFNGTEFTSSVSAVTAGITVSGAPAMAAAITYDNLVTLAYSVELERGLSPEWFLPRGAMKDIVALVDSNGSPIFNPVPVSGAPAGTLLGYAINIVPSISNTPDDGAIRIAFGDPSQYIIALRQGIVFQANPYISMKEGMTQFIGYARADGNYANAGAWTTLQRND